MILTKKRDITPLIMWLVLFAGILILAFIRLGRTFGVWDQYPVNFYAIFISLYILWMIIKLNVSKKDVNTEGKKISDFMTCQLYGLRQALTILTALWFTSVWRVPNSA